MLFAPFGKIGVETHQKSRRKQSQQFAHFNNTRVGGVRKKEFFTRKEDKNDTYRRATHRNH